jgi:hypothetical protein
MAAKEINSKASGNNSIEKSSGSELKINTQNIADERISTELWMQHFANTLLNQNAIGAIKSLEDQCLIDVDHCSVNGKKNSNIYTVHRLI